MKNLRIKNIQDVERLIWLFYRYLPLPPSKVTSLLATYIPYISIALAGYFFTIALLPFVFPDYPLDPLKSTDLFTYNIILSRILFGLMGAIIIVTYNQLIAHKTSGWNNLFYLTLFHTFFLLVLFNIPSLAILLVSWYVLFAIKPHYS